MSRWLPILLLPFALAGCGEKNLIDEGLKSHEQVRSLVKQFQGAVAEDNGELACDLMEEPEAPCDIDGLLFGGQPERMSLPGAREVYIHINKHRDAAEVQLGNGTRFGLRRHGDDPDAEWRIASMGFSDEWRRDALATDAGGQQRCTPKALHPDMSGRLVIYSIRCAGRFKRLFIESPVPIDRVLTTTAPSARCTTETAVELWCGGTVRAGRKLWQHAFLANRACGDPVRFRVRDCPLEGFCTGVQLGWRGRTKIAC
ncbi:MAG: hypothetical protein ACRDL6_07990 [Solirubrobacterales bacterium]